MLQSSNYGLKKITIGESACMYLKNLFLKSSQELITVTQISNYTELNEVFFSNLLFGDFILCKFCKVSIHNNVSIYMTSAWMLELIELLVTVGRGANLQQGIKISDLPLQAILVPELFQCLASSYAVRTLLSIATSDAQMVKILDNYLMP